MVGSPTGISGKTFGNCRRKIFADTVPYGRLTVLKHRRRNHRRKFAQ